MPVDIPAAHRCAEDAFRFVLEEVLRSGTAVPGVRDPSIGNGRGTLELLNKSFVLADMRCRLTSSRPRQLNMVKATARFLWLMSGSDRLADIEAYEPRARLFSHDGVGIRGSSYGHRLLIRSGHNQLEAVIDLLRRDPSTRRAVVSVYMPEDAGSCELDIPCVLSLIFHVRDGLLHASTIMRSNNALGVLPYNVFEFTMLAEVVAREVGVEVGHYFHFAASMHLYEDDEADARACLEAPHAHAAAMPPMPPQPLKALEELIKFERHVRLLAASEVSSEPNGAELSRAVEKARSFDAYWSHFAGLLLHHWFPSVWREV